MTKGPMTAMQVKERIVRRMIEREGGATTSEILHLTGWRSCHHVAMPHIAKAVARNGSRLDVEGVEGTPECRYSVR
jgi:hypothetical protein